MSRLHSIYIKIPILDTHTTLQNILDFHDLAEAINPIPCQEDLLAKLLHIRLIPFVFEVGIALLYWPLL